MITDIRMPGIDGLDAAKQIYAEGPLPIVVVSGYDDPELVERAKHNHVSACLVKPITEEDLGSAILIAMRRFSEFQADRRQAET